MPVELVNVPKLAFPLDGMDQSEVASWIDLLSSQVPIFKVGLELFCAAGPEVISCVHAAGKHCFLDLKLHDIPATMEGAVRRVADHGVRYLTVHASAGGDALSRVQAAVQGTSTQVIAVTCLTSLADRDVQVWHENCRVAGATSALAKLAWQAGIRAFVCSPHECHSLRKMLGPDAKLVVPGIREEMSAQDDQQRTASVAAAVKAGASMLVVGRPIRHATDPVEKAAVINQQAAAAAGHHADS